MQCPRTLFRGLRCGVWKLRGQTLIFSDLCVLSERLFVFYLLFMFFSQRRMALMNSSPVW